MRTPGPRDQLSIVLVPLVGFEPTHLAVAHFKGAVSADCNHRGKTRVYPLPTNAWDVVIPFNCMEIVASHRGHVQPFLKMIAREFCLAR